MAIDLSTIVYRVYQSGDLEPETPPTPGSLSQSSNVAINLDGIKFRAKQVGDVEE